MYIFRALTRSSAAPVVTFLALEFSPQFGGSCFGAKKIGFKQDIELLNLQFVRMPFKLKLKVQHFVLIHLNEAQTGSSALQHCFVVVFPSVVDPKLFIPDPDPALAVLRSRSCHFLGEPEPTFCWPEPRAEAAFVKADPAASFWQAKKESLFKSSK